MKIYQSLEVLSKYKSVCLIGHSGPDADAFASMLVLKDFLVQHFKINKVDVFAECDRVSENCEIIVLNEQINPRPKVYDVAIMMDSPNTKRLGAYKNLFNSAKFRIVIDHHQTNLYEGEINIVEPISSTCEIIYSILKHFKFPLSKTNQERIYSGIITDTNNLTVGKFNSSTFKILSEIIDNIDSENIYNNFFNNNSLKNMQLLSVAIQNLKTYENGKILISNISFNQAKKLNANFDDFIGISNRLSTIGKCSFLCFIYPKDNNYYVSLRASKSYNVADIAKRFGGGGHNGAAAYLTKNKSIKKISEEILNQFLNKL